MATDLLVFVYQSIERQAAGPTRREIVHLDAAVPDNKK